MVGAPRSCADKNALTGSLELVVALLTGVILLGEGIDRLKMTAMVLITLALFIKQVEKKPIAEALATNTAIAIKPTNHAAVDVRESA